MHILELMHSVPLKCKDMAVSKVYMVNKGEKKQRGGMSGAKIVYKVDLLHLSHEDV
jgi:hypothetical protein